MKKNNNLIICLLLIFVLIGFFGCSEPDGDTDTPDTGQVASPTFYPGEGTYSSNQNVYISSSTPGNSIYFTIDGSEPTTASIQYTGAIDVSATVILKAIAVKDNWTDSEAASAGYIIDKFPVSLEKREMVTVTGGTYNQKATSGTPDNFDHTISDFQMAKYEVTYELWYTVHNWALSNGYTFANPGREGNDGAITNPAGAVPTGAKYEPVTTINWRDAIVWCNAYSEMAGLTPCYTYTGLVIKDSEDANSFFCDNAVCDWTANGYRLPTEGEWQFAASNKGVKPYNYASGATADYTDFDATSLVAWFGNSTTKDVGTKNENALDIFDMSGNVWEWCWDWYTSYPGASTDYRGPGSGSSRIFRGGSWGDFAIYLQVGTRFSDFPIFGNCSLGFRLARTF